MSTVLKNSLAAATISNRLAERHGKHNVSQYEQPFLGMTFKGRYCAIKGERSGGYVLTGTLTEKYGHASGPQQRATVTKRLKPGWQSADKQRAIQRIINELASRRDINRRRERVYQLAESLDLDMDRVEAIAKTSGRPLEYHVMTADDCDFWLAELEKMAA